MPYPAALRTHAVGAAIAESAALGGPVRLGPAMPVGHR